MIELQTPSLSDFAEHDLAPWLQKARDLLPACLSGEEAYAESLGWLDIEKWSDEKTVARIEQLAAMIRQRDEIFVLIGVGGSNNAARAVIESIGSSVGPKVVYAGNNLSPYAMNQVLEQVQNKDFSIHVIAKNFETIEPGLAFRVLRQELTRRYGLAAKERIIATGTFDSTLEALCTSEGYTFLPFPTDIGGRFTALSSVGLLPMAVAGVDIRQIIAGAKGMRAQLEHTVGEENPAVQYAAVRNLLYQEGYRMELLASFEPRLKWFSKWWIQLFGESEGKNGRGLFPVAAEYSEDLHAIGQFVQEGTPILFETMLDITDAPVSFKIPADTIDDYFHYVAGMELGEINRAALEATVQAHSQVLPVLRISFPQLNALAFGELFYFFQFACYLSGKTLEVNPFDQPGVEAYKCWMFQRLGK